MSTTNQQKFPFAYRDVYEAVRQTLISNDYNIEMEDDLIGRFEVKSSMSMFSWGETLWISVEDVDGRSTIVTVSSQLSVAENRHVVYSAEGKNAKHITTIMSGTSRHLRASASPPPSEESSATPPVVGDLPDDPPPVPDDDLGELPPVPDDDLADLLPIDGGDALPPIVPGETDSPVVEPVVAVSEPPEVELPPVDDHPPPPPPPVHVGKLVLESVSSPGQTLSMGVSTKIGKRLCRGMGEDHKFLDDEQMEIIKTDSGWQVSPNASAKNETLLNNEAITTPQDLKEGDILAVGRVARGVSKMEMRVSFSG